MWNPARSAGSPLHLCHKWNLEPPAASPSQPHLSPRTKYSLPNSLTLLMFCRSPVWSSFALGRVAVTSCHGNSSTPTLWAVCRRLSAHSGRKACSLSPTWDRFSSSRWTEQRDRRSYPLWVSTGFLRQSGSYGPGLHCKQWCSVSMRLSRSRLCWKANLSPLRLVWCRRTSMQDCNGHGRRLRLEAAGQNHLQLWGLKRFRFLWLEMA